MQHNAYDTFVEVLIVFETSFPEYLESSQLLKLTIDEFSNTVGPAYPTLQMNDRE